MEYFNSAKQYCDPDQTGQKCSVVCRLWYHTIVFSKVGYAVHTIY